MSFNTDPSKQAREVVFPRKLEESTHSPLSFINITVTQSVTQNHLGMFSNTKLDFQGHIKNIINQVNKTIALLRKLHNTLPSFTTMCNRLVLSQVN